MKIHHIKQGDTAWELLRVGKVTASEMDALVTPEYALRKGDGVKSYLYQKAAERVMGTAESNGSTWAMDNGNVVEKIALPWYEFAYDCKIDRVGFCESDCSKFGCSPDALVGEDGGLEVKSPLPPQHTRYLLEGVVPKQYRVQCQMALYVTGRKWWKFISFHPYMPPLVVDVLPDPLAQEAIATALAAFIPQLDAAHEKLSRMMTPKGRAEA